MPDTRFRFTQGSSGRIVGTIQDRLGHLVPASDLSTAFLTFWDHDSGTIINSRDQEDILGSSGSPLIENGVSLWDSLQTDEDGTTYNFEWLLEGSSAPGANDGDNPIITSRRQVERHKALVRFTSATDVLPMEFEIDVLNVREPSAGSPP